MLNASEPKIKSKDDVKEWHTVCMRSGRIVKPPILYMKKQRVEGVLSIIHQNYYDQLCKLGDEETKNISILVWVAYLITLEK